jgi:hypothetical protein
MVTPHKIAALVAFPKRQAFQVLPMRVNLAAIGKFRRYILAATAAINLPDTVGKRNALHSASRHSGRASPVALETLIHLLPKIRYCIHRQNQLGTLPFFGL